MFTSLKQERKKKERGKEEESDLIPQADFQKQCI